MVAQIIAGSIAVWSRVRIHRSFMGEPRTGAVEYGNRNSTEADMRALCNAVVMLLAMSSMSAVAELACGTGAENDRRARALHDRIRTPRSRIASLATPQPMLRDGGFYLQADE